MAKLQFSNKAVEDLSGIWNYTAEEWCEQQADQYFQMLIASCDKIAEKPALLGRKYDEIEKDLLGFKAKKHVVFYKIIDSETVFIIRILHEQMDLKNRITE